MTKLVVEGTTLKDAKQPTARKRRTHTEKAIEQILAQRKHAEAKLQDSIDLAARASAAKEDYERLTEVIAGLNTALKALGYEKK